MADRNTEQGTQPKNCFGMMKEMMRNMISDKGEGCSCMETMSGMMRSCCSGTKEGPAEGREQDVPK